MLWFGQGPLCISIISYNICTTGLHNKNTGSDLTSALFIPLNRIRSETVKKNWIMITPNKSHPYCLMIKIVFRQPLPDSKLVFS